MTRIRFGILLATALVVAAVVTGCSNGKTGPAPTSTRARVVVELPTARVAPTSSPTAEGSLPPTAPTPGPTATQLPPTPLPSASEADTAGIEAAARGFFVAYNAGKFAEALRFTNAETSNCGGITNYAFAYAQLQRIEKVRYEISAVKVSGVKGNVVSTNLTRNEFDITSGKPGVTGAVLGFDFVKVSDRWMYASDPLPQVRAFCK